MSLTRIRETPKDVLLELKQAMSSRPGTANSDVNVFAIKVPVKYYVLRKAIDEIERLRALYYGSADFVP